MQARHDGSRSWTGTGCFMLLKGLLGSLRLPGVSASSIPLLGLQLPTFTPTDFTQPAPRGPVEVSLFHLLQEAFLDLQGVLAIYSRNIPSFHS